MEYEQLDVYKEFKNRDEGNLNGNSGFLLKALDCQEFEMPSVCH